MARFASSSCPMLGPVRGMQASGVAEVVHHLPGHSHTTFAENEIGSGEVARTHH